MLLAGSAIAASFGVVLIPGRSAVVRLDPQRRHTWRLFASARSLDARAVPVLIGLLLGIVTTLAVGKPSALVAMSVLGSVLGYVESQRRLRSLSRRQEQEVAEQLPVLVELLALAVSAGEAPASALARICERGEGILLDALRGAVSDLRLGSTLVQALTQVRAALPYPSVERLVEGITIGHERGTPLTEILHAQALDARERQRRLLMERAASSEVAMMIPVVFLIMPITIVFALYPSFYHMTWI